MRCVEVCARWFLLIAIAGAARPARADVKCINVDLPLPSSGLREFVGQSVCIVVAKPRITGQDHSEQAAGDPRVSNKEESVMGSTSLVSRRGSAGSAVATIALMAMAGVAQADVVSIDVGLPVPASGGGGSYQLAGQSAFVMLMTSGMTTGGQLDDVMSPGAGISYTEIFPPASLAEYQSFGYFGRIRTLDDGGDVIDTSLIVALRPGVGIGQTIDSIFGGPDEATLVAAFETFDSPEFEDMLGAISGVSDALGAVAIPPIGRGGEALTLVAFTAGPDGDLGAAVGTLAVTVTPAPGTALLPGLLMLGANRRRR